MPRLFEPITLRDVTVRNRVWLAPMCQYSVERRDGVPTPWHLVHLGARAQGGFGLVMTEATAVSPEGRISPQDTGIWNDEQRDAWAPVAAFIASMGAVPAIQLAHAGRKASTYRGFPGEATGVTPTDGGGWDVVGPSEQPFEGLAEPQSLTPAQIAHVVEDFVAAARRSHEAGFDVVEIHAAHGYLLHEFLSPLSNHRDDAYGGSFENRTRLVLEVVDAVRAVWPAGKPVLVRISATDWVDGGWSIDDSVRLAGLLRDRGVDLVDTSSGGNVHATIPVGPGYQVGLAAQIKREAQVATGAVGLITDAEQAERVVKDGEADVVLLGREALRDPSWPQHAAVELGADPDGLYPAPYHRVTPRG